MFNIIQSTRGFAGDEEVEVVEANTGDQASFIVHDTLCENIEVYCIESFNTQEEADNYMEDNDYM